MQLRKWLLGAIDANSFQNVRFRFLCAVHFAKNVRDVTDRMRQAH